MSGIYGRIAWPGIRDEHRLGFESMESFLDHLPGYQFARCAGENFLVGVVSPVPFLHPPVLEHAGSGIVLALSGEIYAAPGLEAGRDPLPRLAELFLASGPALPESLEGEYQLLVLDPRRKRALLFTDRFGFRKWYLEELADGLLLAPEVKAILAGDGHARRTDRAAFADLANYGYPLGARTFFESVKAVGPAARVEAGPAGVRRERYWRPAFAGAGEADSFDAAVRHAGELWQAAVARRMGQDSWRPGISLSGGLDSRFILAAAAALRPGVRCWTYGNPACLDVRIARRVAASLQVPHTAIPLQPDCFREYGERALWLTEGMSQVPNALQLSTYPAVAGSYELHLSGFAGDLVLGGSYIQAPHLRRPAEPELLANNALERMALFRGADSPRAVFTDDFAAFLAARRRASVAEEIQACGHAGLSVNQFREKFFIENHCRRLINQINLQQYFNEERFPYFDYALADYLFRLPEDYRLNHRLFHALFRGLYPRQAEITWQKTGGNCFREPSAWVERRRRAGDLFVYYAGRVSAGRWNPVSRVHYDHYNQWYRRDGSVRASIREVLLDSETLGRGLFRRSGVEDLLRQQDRGQTLFGRLAGLYNIEMWHRLFPGIRPGSENPLRGRIL